MWYRLEVEVPTLQAGQKVRLHGLAVETEAWVWVNGEFVGNRPYQEAYLRPNSLDLDVTNTIRGGERNAIVIRVHTNYQPAQMSGGLVSRLFLYTPKD
jgi:beta-galactosidase